MRTATPDEGLRSELQAALAQKFPRRSPSESPPPARLSDQPFQGGVLPLQVLQTLRVVGLQAGDLVTPPVVVCSETCSSQQTSPTSLPSPSIRLACANVRTTCSGLCLFLVAI